MVEKLIINELSLISDEQTLTNEKQSYTSSSKMKHYLSKLLSNIGLVFNITRSHIQFRFSAHEPQATATGAPTRGQSSTTCRHSVSKMIEIIRNVTWFCFNNVFSRQFHYNNVSTSLLLHCKMLYFWRALVCYQITKSHHKGFFKTVCIRLPY